MDVRCDRCQTEYEFDENYLTPNGVAVKCTTCGNVFKVRRSITQPLMVVGAGASPSSTSTSLPAATHPSETRLSLVRWRAGQTLPLKDLPELQRWVVERKVTRDDEVSFGGEGFRKLGSLPELNSFFQLVDAADRAQAPVPAPPAERVDSRADSRPALSPTLINTTPGFPDAPKALGSPALLTPEPAWTGQRRATSPMNMATLVDEEIDSDDLSRLKGSRTGVWLLLLILIGGGAGGVWWYLNDSALQRPASKPHAPAPPAATAPTPEAVPAPAATPQAVPSPGAPPGALPGSAPAAVPSPPATGGPAPATAPDPHATAPSPAAVPPAVPAPTPAPPSVGAPSAPAAAPKAEAEAPAAKIAAAAAASPPAGSSAATKPDFAGYMARGRRLLDTRPGEALEMFKKASQLAPSSPEPYAARGLAYTDMQYWDAAIEAFNGALSRNPQFSDAVMGLAEAYRYKGDKEKAQLNYQKYLEMNPSGPDARVARVQLDLLKGIAPVP